MNDVSDNNFQPHIDLGNDYFDYIENENESQSSEVVVNTNDYSSYFENIQSLHIFIIALIIGLFIGSAFVWGFSRER